MKIHVCFDAVSGEGEIYLEDLHPQVTVELRKLQGEDKLQIMLTYSDVYNVLLSTRQ